MFSIAHETWRGEVGNCIATPRFEFKIGYRNTREEVCAIVLEHHGSERVFKVFWKFIMPEVVDRR
jgi:hypothetical protein